MHPVALGQVQSVNPNAERNCMIKKESDLGFHQVQINVLYLDAKGAYLSPDYVACLNKV